MSTTVSRPDVPATDFPGRRGAVLLVAALAVLLLLGTDRFGYPEVPALVGLGYLAGAVAGGPSDALWAPALVVSGWGLGNVALG